MKRVLLSSVFVAACLSALGQGKVTLCNDAGCPYELNGQPIPPGPLPSGLTFMVGLYGGTSSSTMSLQSQVILNPPGGIGLPPGIVRPTHVVCSFPGGVTSYFQVFVWDAAYASPQVALAAGALEGHNNIFTMIPGTSISFPLITTGGSTTWAAVGNETPLNILAGFPVSISLSGDHIVLSWNAIVGYHYQVQFKSDLNEPYWPFGYQILATNTVLSVSDYIQAGSSRFYRVQEFPF